MNISNYISFFKNNKFLLFIAGCFSIIVTSCSVSYSLNGASIPLEAKTVSVSVFQNFSTLAPPTLSQSFTEALRTKLSSQSRLSLISKGGDLAFEGSISGYSIMPTSVQSSDQAAYNRLTITVNVKYDCSFDEKKNFEQSFSRYSDYKSTENIVAIESQLIQQITDLLTQDIFNKAFNNW